MSRSQVLVLLVAVAALALGCGSGEVQGAGPSGGGAFGPADDPSDTSTCTDSSDCDDGRYCNGEEKCDRGYCRAGELVACDDRIDCTRDSCDESADRCQHTPNHASCEEGLCDPARGCGEGQACANDGDCDDEVFCNGVERCGDDGACTRGEPVACDDGNDCTVDQCSEAGRACDHEMRDADGDGHGDAACRGGDDCDDEDRGVRPGAREVCDDGHDNDCDRQRDCSDPACADDRACADDAQRDDRDNADRDNADRDNADRDNADRDNADRGNADRDADPCLRNGWYNDGECDDVCARRDPDCDRAQDSCEDRRWYRDGICDDSCRRQDPDCPARGDDACRYANDGTCDEPDGTCAAGTDTTDCRPDQARRGADSCRYANDHVCDERVYCPRGTDGRDCTDGGPDSCYFANDGHCDAAPTCAAGTDRTDCAGAGEEAGDAGGARGGAGACGGLTYQGRCQDSHTVEFCVNAGRADEHRQVNACTDGRECRWENAQTGYTCLAPDAGAGAAGDAGGARTVPAGWTCSAAYYDVGDDCDCGCGVRDPDCDSPWLRVLNCADGQSCGANGACTGTADDTVPWAWSCTDSWYDADDGCDCNCGAPDPDCEDEGATLYHCDAGQVCNATGHCVAGDDTSDDETPDPGCYWDPECGTEAADEQSTPAGWTCRADYYDADDGCDCDCGVRDPDCADPGVHVYGCADGEVCGAGGDCESPEADGPPLGWSCSPGYYDAGDGCDCDCGAYDPDCDDAAARVYNCELGETCGWNGLCESAEPDPAPDGGDAPGAWTCPASYYGAGDGCDCECGAYDPDCDDPNAQVYGCTQGQVCGWDGTCQTSDAWI